MNTETPHHGGHEWIHSETIDPHRHIYDEEWVCVCESGDLQMRIYHSIPCDDGEFWLAEISNGHEPEKGGYRVCGVMVEDFDTARTWCEATLPIAKVILRDTTVEAKYCTLAAAQTRIAELEEERDMLRNALARIRDYNPPDEMSHKAWRVRINVMRNWAGQVLAWKGRKDGEG